MSKLSTGMDTNMQRTGSSRLKYIEYCFWLAGFIALLSYGCLISFAALAESRASDEFLDRKLQRQLAAEAPATVSPQEPSDDSADLLTTATPTLTDRPPETSLWSPSFLRNYQQAMTTAEVRAVGLLRVSSVGIDVAVFDDATKDNLNRGAARVASTGEVDSHQRIAIAGHRDGWFRPLKDIQIGDQITLETSTQVREFEIFNTKIVDPSDVSVLKGSEQTLVLITCYPFYFVGHAPKRFIVEAVEINTPL
jgi:LPXTG-site transpeptidase (sortase) family protein